MRVTRLLTLALVLAACKGATGPAAVTPPPPPPGLDPIVLMVNQRSDNDTLAMTWFDQAGQVATFRAAPGTKLCVQFTSTTPVDSVRFIVAVGGSSLDTLPGSGPNWGKAWSPWFNPQTGLTADPTQYPFGAEYWVATAPAGGSVTMFNFPKPAC
jgi:hypothetical protein